MPSDIASPRCGGTGKIDLGPQGPYSLAAERYAPCFGCPDCAKDRLLAFLRNENYEWEADDGVKWRAWPADDIDRLLLELTEAT